MPTPVIIAAHNEARLIGLCLDSLGSDVEPIVAANGCEDDTVRIARDYGVKVLELTTPGKLPAIQMALGSLGARALEPVLYLDADSYPLKSSEWVARMGAAVQNDTHEAQAASGPLAYFDGNPLSDAVRSLKRYYDVKKALRNDTTRFWGNNMATQFDQATLDEVMDMPHIWPGEDRAIEMKIQEHGGTSRQIAHRDSVVVTSSRYMLPISRILAVGTDQARKETLSDYNERAADGSIPLAKYVRQSKRRKARHL